jgi:hypothetical protein
MESTCFQKELCMFQLMGKEADAGETRERFWSKSLPSQARHGSGSGEAGEAGEAPVPNSKGDYFSNLYEEILAYLKKYSRLRDDKQWNILACSVFLSYIQDNESIHYLPIIYFESDPVRGKSRTGSATLYISYRGIHNLDLREATIFRWAEDLKATMFFDVFDLWKKATRRESEDLLLNRYEKGAGCARVKDPKGAAHEDIRYYDVYGSTIIATNEKVNKVLESSCICISMPNKPGRYPNPKRKHGKAIREKLQVFRAFMMDKDLPEVEIDERLTGRFYDITRPLLQVCKLIASEKRYNELLESLLSMAKIKVEEAGQTVEGIIFGFIKEAASGFSVGTPKMLWSCRCRHTCSSGW